ncbi:M48 family metalloprotease [Bradyrhizobium centrosematis]|uniref:M48 family metalloprotease n=1 Tax=Bradyrhizobium centrosematis TaxID=1300039 RepID=UPI002169F5CE|nr:M48 family metalloprotease [Bradyrhizobium centrosematis]MCS3763175.1 Zn-dependent protease with chaperone function [Bradyrhizobium centrosematis]MCS3775842.1 Zn-dependent protease with chaperone function [Bradyrhizobium centrosematis]
MGHFDDINPATLPSSTRERFGLLLTAASFLNAWLGSAVVLELLALIQEVGLPQLPQKSGTVQLLGALAVLSLLVLTTALFYLTHPLRQARAFGDSESLDASSSAARRVSEIAIAANISPPSIVMDKDLHHVDALAFGLPGSRTILMGRGLLLLLAKRPNEFDVRLAHEIAHIKNGDVDFGFLAQAVVKATKVLLFLLLFLWLFCFCFWSYKRWDAFGPFFSAGYPLSSFTSYYRRLASGFVGRGAIVFLFGMTFFLLLVVTEYRSFLRSREHYADVFASHMISLPAFASAFSRIPSQPNVFLDLYSAHPAPQDRTDVARSPMRVFVPRLTYFVYLGSLCGVIFAFISYFSALAANLSAAFDVSDAHSYMDAMGNAILRWHVTAITFLSLVLLFPFVAAVGSLGTRACILNVLQQRSILRRLRDFAIGGALISIFFMLGCVIDPLISAKAAVELTQAGTLSAKDFLPSLWSFEIAAAIFGAYVTTNLLFASGLRPSLQGYRERPPGLIWQLFASVLWMYCYLMIFQPVVMTLDHFFADEPAVPLLSHMLILGVLGVVMVAVCWAVLFGLSTWVSRRHCDLKSSSNLSKRDNWAPWLYFHRSRADALRESLLKLPAVK